MNIKVKSKYIKTSPTKLKLLTDLVQNMQVWNALAQLRSSRKQTSKFVIHLINSGVSAAKDKGLKDDDLYIKSIVCDKGPTLKRMQYCPRGRSGRIKKRMSHITLIITDERKSEIRNPKFQTISKSKLSNKQKV